MVGRVTQACLAGMGTCLLFLAEADACICSTQHPASSIHSSVRSRLAAGCSGTHPTHSAAPEWGIGRGRDLDPHSPQQHGAHNSWLRNAELSTARQPQHSTRSTLGRRRRMHHLRTTHQHTRSDSYPVVWLTPVNFDITRNPYAHASPPIEPFLVPVLDSRAKGASHPPGHHCTRHLARRAPAKTPHGSAAAGQAAGPG